MARAAADPTQGKRCTRQARLGGAGKIHVRIRKDARVVGDPPRRERALGQHVWAKHGLVWCSGAQHPRYLSTDFDVVPRKIAASAGSANRVQLGGCSGAGVEAVGRRSQAELWQAPACPDTARHAFASEIYWACARCECVGRRR